jgi:oligosaccharide repeat unit polymerase
MFLFLYWKNKNLTIGVYLLAWYTVFAWFSVLYFKTDLFHYFRGYEKIRLLPFLYLVVTILLYMYPILKFDSSKIKYIKVADPHILFKFIILMLFMQALVYIGTFPSVLKAALSPSIGDLRDTFYDDDKGIVYSNIIFQKLAVLNSGMANINIIVSSYSLVFMNIKRKLIKLYFISSFLLPLYIYFALANRFVMMIQLGWSIFIFILLLSFISRKVKKKFTIYITGISIPILALFFYISNSRFGNTALYMFYKYCGESFINYNADFFYDLKGQTSGSAYFTVFSKWLGHKNNFTTLREKWAYIDNITGIDSHVFYTFVGGFNIEFGFIATIFIGLSSSFLIYKYLRPFSILTLSKMIVIGMLGLTLLKGVFLFPLQGGGNIELLFTIIAALLFKRIETREKIRKVE